MAEANSYEKMVEDKLQRRKETGINSFQKIMKKSEEISATLKNKQDHLFQQSFYKQESFETRRFLWFRINKKVSEQLIPVGLCAICEKLEIEHNA